MSSDNRASYARIGIIVTSAVVAILVTLIWLGGLSSGKDYFFVESYYDSAVSGLSVGSPVNFRGVKIGEVHEITLASLVYGGKNPKEMQRIVLTLAINKKACGIVDSDDDLEQLVKELVEAGVRATVTASGITGLSRIELNIVENAPPPIPLNWRPRYPVIPSSPSLFDSFSVAATKMMNRMKTMDFSRVWSNVCVLSESAARLADRCDALVESQGSGMAEIVENMNAASASLRDLSANLRDNPSLLLHPQEAEPLPETAQ